MKVLVTSATRNSGMAIIRALAKERWEVVGADDRVLPARVHCRYTKPYYVLPRPEGELEFLRAVMRILKKEKPDVLLPLRGVGVISKEKEKIEKVVHVLVPPYESYRIAEDNQLTVEECKRLKIASPLIYRPREAIKRLEKMKGQGHGERLVVKPRKEIGGAMGLEIVQDVRGLIEAKAETERLYGKSVIQEYIPGPTENMRTLNLLFDRAGNLALYFTTKKIRQWPETGGISVLSESMNEPWLVDMILPFFRRWRWQGPAEVEMKIDSRDQCPKVIEINPRFWGYIGFPIRCGVNFPVLACKLATSRAISDLRCDGYPTGVKYINLSAYVRSVISELVFGGDQVALVKKVFKELKGPKVTNNLELRDFRAILAKLIFEAKSKNIAF